MKYTDPKLTYLENIQVAPIGGTVELKEYSDGFVELWIRISDIYNSSSILDAKQLYTELKNYFENKQQEN